MAHQAVFPSFILATLPFARYRERLERCVEQVELANRQTGGRSIFMPNISHCALFGQLPRLAGADGSIFPNCGGCFVFTRDDCRAIAEGTAVEIGEIEPIFPAPGGAYFRRLVEEM